MSRLELEHINTLWFMTLGVTAISAGVLVYVLLLESALGAFSIREFYPSSSDRENRPRIAVLASDYTKNLRQPGILDEDGTWYDNLLISWENYLSTSDYRSRYDWIDDRLLEQDRRLLRYDVLILPATLALSDLQIERIKLFMEQGGGVFASWKVGFYRPDGSRRGEEMLTEMFGVEVVDEVDRYEGTYRSYQAIYPGTVEPGIYIPVNNVLSGIEESEFSPLAGYRWHAPYDGVPPRSDYAQADTLTLSPGDALAGQGNREAVKVNYFSWMGDRSGRKVPYVYAGYGMEEVALFGKSPVTRNLPPGYTFFVQVYDPAMRLRIATSSAHAFGYWKEGATSRHPSPLDAFTSLVHGTYKGGRFVYAGFRRDAMGVGHINDEDILYIDRLFENMLQYLRRQPTVWLKDWPAPYDGAALFSGVGRDRLDYLLDVAETLDREDVRSTYFLEPAQADLYRSVVEQLSMKGEVGVLDQFTDREGNGEAVSNMVEPGDEDPVVQRFEHLKEVLEEITQSEINSYRSDGKAHRDSSLHKALARAGYRSFFADSIERQSVPRVLRYTQPRMMQFNLTAWTDKELLPPVFGDSVDLTPLHKDIERLAEEGSLYQLVYSTEGFGHPAYQGTLTDIVRTLKANRFWIATGSNITHWWRKRNGVKATLEKSGDARLVLHLSNQNGEAVQDVGVVIDIGRSVNGVRIRPELIGSAIPEHTLSQENAQLFITVSTLKPQQTRLFHIDLIHEDGVQIIARYN